MMAGNNSSAPFPSSFIASIVYLQQSTIHDSISNALSRVVIIANEWTASEMAEIVDAF